MVDFSINWEDNPKWIGPAVAILLLVLKSLITYLWSLKQDGRKPKSPTQSGKASPGEALAQPAVEVR